MANHCIDLICTDCGASWCDRGCGYGSPPNLEYLNKWIEMKQKWNNKFKNGSKFNPSYTQGESCHHCNSRKISIE